MLTTTAKNQFTTLIITCRLEIANMNRKKNKTNRMKTKTLHIFHCEVSISLNLFMYYEQSISHYTNHLCGCGVIMVIFPLSLPNIWQIFSSHTISELVVWHLEETSKKI
jgi:hypothetical protein